MKPTEEQIKGLQAYLRKTLHYKESYEEVFDHIISALADKPAGVNFQQTVNDIIRADFGSHKNLLQVEEGIGAAITADTYKRFHSYITDLIRLPTIFYLAGAAFAIYWLYTFVNFSPLGLKVSVFVVILSPVNVSYKS